MSVIYNGVDLETTFGLTMLGRGTYGAAERDIEQIHVPGRNGDLLYDNGGFLNVEVVYPCSITENFANKASELRNFLLSSPGYHKLEDSYHPGEYRMAEFRGPFEPDVHTARNNDSANFELKFNAKPQRFLSDAETNVYYPHVTLSSPSGSAWTYEFRFPLKNGQTAELIMNQSNVSSTVWKYTASPTNTTEYTATYAQSGDTYSWTATRDCYLDVKVVSVSGNCMRGPLWIDGEKVDIGAGVKFGAVVNNTTFFRSEPVISVTFKKVSTSDVLTCKWGPSETSVGNMQTFTVDISNCTNNTYYTYIFDSEYETVRTSTGYNRLSNFDGSFPYFEGDEQTMLCFGGADRILVQVQTRFWRV